MSYRKIFSRGCLLAAMLVVPRHLMAGEIVQQFPADEREMQTRWRIEWGIEHHAGGAQILYIKNAYFTRAPGQPEVKVLGDSRLSEIFVPYNNGTNIYDISGFSHFTLVDLNRSALGPACLAPGQIYDKNGTPAETGPVAVEVHDDHLRWWKNGTETCRRGQELHLWSVLYAVNYRYVLLYIFRDDGQIGFRVGATASNLYDLQNRTDDGPTHLHTGCWRVNLALGKQEDVVVSKVRLDTRQRKTFVQQVTKEERIPWNLEEFTRLLVQNTKQTNGHTPPAYIGYDLVPMSSGVGRYYGEGEGFTQRELWVTRDNSSVPELRCRDLPSYENGQSLSGGRPVLWHLAALLHRPRDEDFGKVEFKAGQGTALTTWGGFDLKPRNLFPNSPLYPGGAPKCSP